MDDKNALLLSAAAQINRPYQHQQIGGALKTSKHLAADGKDLRLQAVCSEMESLFINYLFKEMRETIHKSGFISGGRAEEIFTSMLDVELSRKISAAGGIGLAALLLKQLGGPNDDQMGAESP